MQKSSRLRFALIVPAVIVIGFGACWAINRDSPQVGFESAVVTGRLPPGRIIYAKNSSSGFHGSDSTIVRSLVGCSVTSCIPHAELLKACEKGRSCSGWKQPLSLAPQVLSPPLGGYPGWLEARLIVLTHSPSSRCESYGELADTYGNYLKYETLCIDDESGLLLYRSFSY